MALSNARSKKLKAVSDRCDALEKLMADSDVTSNPEKLRELGKEFSTIEPLSRLYREFVHIQDELAKCREEAEKESDPEMADLFREESAELERKLAECETRIEEKLEGGGDDANRPVILEIRSGTGGDEAALFAGDLYRMYSRFAENQGWTLEPLSASPTQLGGFKEVVFSVKGNGSFYLLQYESGVHRVQRVPVTETSGRIHTSAATVAVLVEPDEVEVEINPVYLKIDTYRAQGAGGQHVNKTDSAVRIQHIPTGLVVECQDERSQHQNRAKAMRLLRARILDQLQHEQQQQISADRKNQVGSGDRSERIRTYNFPQNRLTDHRAGITLYKLDLIIEGELGLILEPLVKHMREAAEEQEALEAGGTD